MLLLHTWGLILDKVFNTGPTFYLTQVKMRYRFMQKHLRVTIYSSFSLQDLNITVVKFNHNNYNDK